jgi:phosphopantetheinyl transferase
MLGALDPRARRVRAVELWALKESWLKLRGEGIGAPLLDITFSSIEGRWHVSACERATFSLSTLDRHALSVATESDHDVELRQAFVGGPTSLGGGNEQP